MTTEKIACAPKIGDYHLLSDIIMERCLNYKTMRCPTMTKKTMEIGSRHSPDMICSPFKMTLGNFIEAAEQGANVFVMPGTACRLGYYDVLQKQILKDLGYECEMISLFDYIPVVPKLFKTLNRLNPKLTSEDFEVVWQLVMRIAIDMDELGDIMRRNIAFEVNPGEFEAHYRSFLDEVITTQNAEEAGTLGEKYKKIMKALKTNKPDRPIRIGILGEIYMVVEPFANCNIEKWLAEHKVEIIRPFDLTRMAVAFFTVKEQIQNSGGYVNYNIGSTANDAIAQAYEMINDGIDGIIHLKPSSCSPEITAMSVLQNMARDFNVPMMYLTFDTESSETGLHTRLEAFYDMLIMKGLKTA